MTTRRNVLRGLSAVGMLSVAGCLGSGGDESSTDSTDQNQDQDQSQDQQQDQDQDQQAKQSPSARQGDEIPPVEVVINYWSDWKGTITTPSTSTSVQGYGKDAWKLSPTPSYVSVNAQKQDDSREPLTIEIYVDGILVNEQSTTAEYGVVSLSVRP